MRPLPIQQPLEIWLGGIAPSELKRVGRLGDGWLPSFCTPEDVRDGIARIQAVAAEHDRAVDPEHFGALLPYVEGPIPDIVAAGIARRRPDVDPTQVVAAGLDGLRADDRPPRGRGRLEVRRHPAGRARGLGGPPRRGRRRPPPAPGLTPQPLLYRRHAASRGLVAARGTDEVRDRLRQHRPDDLPGGRRRHRPGRRGQRLRLAVDGRARARAGRLPVALPVQPDRQDARPRRLRHPRPAHLARRSSPPTPRPSASAPGS